MNPNDTNPSPIPPTPWGRSTPTQVAHPPDCPVLIFDRDCTFCRSWIERWRQITGDTVDYVPLQDESVAARFPEIARSRLEFAVHLVQPDGRITSGAEAVFRTLSPTRAWPLWLYENVPAFASTTEFAYRVVARHRSAFSLLTRLLWGNQVTQPSHLLVRRLFLSLLALVYFIAFLSLNVQLPGLIGSQGIVPATDVMKTVAAQTTDAKLDRLRLVPTLCWLGTDDRFLRGLCVIGVVLSSLVILNIAPALCLFLLWLIYLSLAQVSTVFLGYQWDNLLIETGFLAIFFAPWRLRPRLASQPPPSRIVLWLLRWLLFRLMFCSGAVKLLSGDLTWHNLAALRYHYETQPLPTALAWHVHNWPAWFHQGSCVAMFVIELAVPFLIFLPRRPRFMAAATFILFMLAIALTGNYTFFNLLTAALCVTLLDDRALTRLLPRPWASRLSQTPAAAPAEVEPRSRRQLRLALLTLLTFIVLSVSAVQMLSLAGVPWSATNPLVKLERWLAPLRSINRYGLFAVMTTSRSEIVVEGSETGQVWLPYEFPYKPGNPARRPGFVAPHQPRLDWQMWFAALGHYRSNPWFMHFCGHLLRGTPEVLALLEHNPFPNQPPHFIRAQFYTYRFSTPAERQTTGSWWHREYVGVYCPTLSDAHPPP